MVYAQIIPKRGTFKYLTFIIQGDGKIDDDVKHRIKVGWMKCRLKSRVPCDKNVSSRLKGKLYRVKVRPTL